MNVFNLNFILFPFLHLHFFISPCFLSLSFPLFGNIVFRMVATISKKVSTVCRVQKTPGPAF